MNLKASGLSLELKGESEPPALEVKLKKKADKRTQKNNERNRKMKKMELESGKRDGEREWLRKRKKNHSTGVCFKLNYVVNFSHVITLF